MFRDQDGQLDLTLPGDTPGDIIQATIKTYIPIDGYVVSIVRLVGHNDATGSLARNCKTWTVDTIEEAKQWLTNHGLDIDAYETIDITER